MTRAILLSTLALCLYGQQQSAFDVASVRIEPPDPRDGVTSGADISGSHLRLKAMSLYTLVWLGYNPNRRQILGGPPWAGQDRRIDNPATRRFDIDAKAEGDATRTMDEFRPMLRSLLAERFHLIVHTEKRDTRVYALVIDKGGIKLRESAPGAKTDAHMNGAHRIVATATTIKFLIDGFNEVAGVDRPVIDRTGLAGKYDFTLEWSPPDEPTGVAPDIYTAIRDQLGLRLVPQNAPVEYLVIDHAEMPTEN